MSITILWFEHQGEMRALTIGQAGPKVGNASHPPLRGATGRGDRAEGLVQCGGVQAALRLQCLGVARGGADLECVLAT